MSLAVVLATATVFCAMAQGRVLAGGSAAARASRVRPLMIDGGRGPLPFTRWRGLRRHLDRQARAAIVNGTTAVQGQLGFMAFVVAEFGSHAQLCSGTVVSSNVVLTAAHCAYDGSTGQLLDPSEFTVATGAVDWTDVTTRQLSAVSRVIVDPAYDPAKHDSDVALLVLSQPTTAPVIALAGSADSGLTIPGTSAGIAGWGLTYQGSPTPDVLQWATTVVQPPRYCAQFTTVYDSSSQLCAVDYPYDDDGTCFGDSGGPLLAASAAQLYEIGVTSYVLGNCSTVSADYFTSMIAVQPWIVSEVQAVAPAPPPPAPTTPPSPPAPTPTTPTTTPPPPVSTRPSLPQMSPATARIDARAVLAGVLGNVFDRGHAYKPSCSRASSTRFDCAFTFANGANDYYGDITVYYVSGSGGKTYWTDRYTVGWVNDSCYFHSGHRRRCTIHKRQGAW